MPCPVCTLTYGFMPSVLFIGAALSTAMLLPTPKNAVVRMKNIVSITHTEVANMLLFFLT